MSTGNGTGARQPDPGGAEAKGGPVGEAPRDPVAGKSVSEVFGEIVWLMTQDRAFKALPLAELEWLVMPPILLRQFHIFYAPPKAAPVRLDEAGRPVPAAGAAEAKAPMQPVGAVLFAMASEAVAAALDADAGQKLRLTPGDWRSGAQKRVVRVIAPFGGPDEMLAQMAGGLPDAGAREAG